MAKRMVGPVVVRKVPECSKRYQWYEILDTTGRVIAEIHEGQNAAAHAAFIVKAINGALEAI